MGLLPSHQRTARPLARVSSTGFDPTGAALLAGLPKAGVYDALAPVVSPWSPAPTTIGSETTVPHPTALRDLADRAGVQVAVLRATLDEAVRLDRAIDAKSDDITRRLEQAGRFEREMDRRLEAAGRSVGVLDHAAAALAGLDRVITELRGTRADAEEAFRRELAAQEARFRQQLAEQEARITRLIEQQAETTAARLQERTEAFASRLAEVSHQAATSLTEAQANGDRARDEAARAASDIGVRISAEADRLGAALERQAAQVQARVAVTIDDAAERIADLERTGASVGAAAIERLEEVCERAASVLGYDPRKVWTGAEPDVAPRRDSLADLADRAEMAAKAAEDALLRVVVATDRAGESRAKLESAIAQAGDARTGHQVLAEIAEAEQRLSALRDDLESTASSVRYNLSQAQQAEGILAKTIDRARDKVHSLDHAMDQVTEQAGSMVQVARDVASLVLKAEQTREALAAEVAETDAHPDSAVASRIRPRRAPFGPPRGAHEDDGSAAAA